MNIGLSSNIDQVLGYTARLHPQYRFAAALALTKLAQAGRDAVRTESASVLDKPTPFTQRGYIASPARKGDTLLQSAVDVLPAQANYLRYQIEGGSRSPSKVAQRLPSDVQLNDYGNLPAGLIRQLVARARAGKRTTKGQSRRFGVSQDLDLFYGDPGDGRPAGIYKRVLISSTEHRLVPVIVMPRQAVRYASRLAYAAVIERTVRREADQQLRAAWARAIASAR